MKRNWQIYAYMFDCHEFQYKGRRITGLCYAIKVNQIASYKEVYKYVSIKISKENGFVISLSSKAKNIILQPYKTYALALCENLEEELLEIGSNVITQYNNCIIEGVNGSAESSWALNNG